MSIDYGTGNGFAACLRAITKLPASEIPAFADMTVATNWYQPLLGVLHRNGFTFAGTYLAPPGDDWAYLNDHCGGVNNIYIGKAGDVYRLFRGGKCIDDDKVAAEIFMIRSDSTPLPKPAYVQKITPPVANKLAVEEPEPTPEVTKPPPAVEVSTYPFTIDEALAATVLVDGPKAQGLLPDIAENWVEVYLAAMKV